MSRMPAIWHVKAARIIQTTIIVAIMNLSDADRWMDAWSSRVAFVDEFHLLGGEPTIHPELTGFCPLSCGGIGLKRSYASAPTAFFCTGIPICRNCLRPTNGRSSAWPSITTPTEYRERLQTTFDLIERWQKEFAISVEVDQSFKNWTQRYKGFGADMQPFEDGAPRASWEICPARECMQLFEGKIWKCGPLAYLAMQNAKYGLSSKWDFYLRYKPLEPSCSDSEFDAFLAKEDEPYCGMCSSRRRPLDLPNPIRRHQTQPSHGG